MQPSPIQKNYLAQQSYMISQRDPSAKTGSGCDRASLGNNFPSVTKVKRCGDSISVREASALGYVPSQANTKEQTQQGLVIECMQCYQAKEEAQKTSSSRLGAVGSSVAKMATAVASWCITPAAQAAEVQDISTLEQLMNMQPAGSYKLTKNIDLRGYKCSLTAPFTGSLNGNGFILKNLRTPLFTTLGNGASVTDFTIKNAAISGVGDPTGMTGVGILTNRIVGTCQVSELTFEGCRVTNTGKGDQQATGILAGVDKGAGGKSVISGITIKNCGVSSAGGKQGLLMGKIDTGVNPTLLNIQVQGLFNLGTECQHFLVGDDKRNTAAKNNNPIKAHLDITSNNCEEWETCVGYTVASLECAAPASAPNISELERLVKDWRFILSASIIGGVLVSALSVCMTCKCRSSKAAPAAVAAKKKSGKDRLKDWLLSYPGSAVLGAVAFLVFLKSGGAPAAAIAGFASAAVGGSGEGSVHGDNNVVAGQGQSGLLNINTVQRGGTSHNIYDIVDSATKERQTECLKKGLFFRDPSDSALLAWDMRYEGLQCWTDIPDEARVGKCAPEAAPIRRIGRALRAVTQMSDNPDPYGRNGDQIEWPFNAEHYEAFNNIGLSIITQIYQGVANPMLEMLASYFESDG